MRLGSAVRPRSAISGSFCLRSLSSNVECASPVETRGRKKQLSMANRSLIATQRDRNAALERAASDMKLGWRTIAASVLHRYPTVTPDSPEWEQDMLNLQDEIEAQKRDHFMSQVMSTESQLIPDSNPSYDEILATLPFEPAPRVTKADHDNDRHSLDRKLPESLFLVVKRNRSNNSWQFPQGKLLDTEDNLRSAAERVLDRAVGKTKRYFISNAPIGHFCYAYPPEMQQQRKQFGAKVFFYRAQLITGSVKLETRLYTDYAWVARSELAEYLDKETCTSVEAMLPF